VLEYIIRVAFGVFELSSFVSFFAYKDIVKGILFIVLAIGFILLMLESFYNTFYFRGLSYIVHKKAYKRYQKEDGRPYQKPSKTKRKYFVKPKGGCVTTDFLMKFGGNHVDMLEK